MLKQKRKRGVLLTPEGLQNFQQARLKSESQENFGERYTLEQLSERTGLDIHTIKRVLGGKQAVDKRSIERFCVAFGLELDDSCYTSLNPHKRQDWGESMCVSNFYGRTEDMSTLEKWILTERCRLITLLGMGGVGKTCLSVKLAQQIKERFDCVVWRSLRDAPPLKTILVSLIQFLSEEQETEASLPESDSEKISVLIELMRSQRCLIVLDNLESLLCSSGRAGVFRDGYEGYGELLRRIGQTEHQSCMLVTTREKPKPVVPLEGETLPVRTWRLNGLQQEEGREILNQKGISGSEEELNELVNYYAGNALALKVVATTICDLFEGDVSEFLSEDASVFGDFRDLLDQQFARLSNLEKEIMYWLAIDREPTTLPQLREDFVGSVPRLKLLEGLESLSRRSLIEQNDSSFTLQSVVMEYVTCRLIEEVCQEIVTQSIELFRCYALMKATAKDYVRETQIRVILQPVIDGLLAIFRGQRNVEARLNQILQTQRETSPLEPGYVGGNAINLLCHMGTDLTGYDFSDLTVWQADLRNTCLHNVNFQNADFSKSVFVETFGGVMSVAYSPDGKILAAGDTKGEIRLYRVADGQQILLCQGHKNWVPSLAFSPDGRILASSSTDYTVKLWDSSTGQCLKTLNEHKDEVWSVDFHPNGNLLASGSDDSTIKLWEVSTGQCLKTFQGHYNDVHAVAFSPDGQTLASGSADLTISLWNINTGGCFKTFEGHCAAIRSITFSPDGQTLASGSEDQTIKLWDINSGECLKTFQGHSNVIWFVNFNSQGDLLVSSSQDQTVKLWNINNGQCLKTFQGHSNCVFSVAFNPQGDILTSGSHDQTLKLWSVRNGQCIKTIQGYTNQILSAAYNPDGQILASGGHDQKVRLWNVKTGQIIRTFQGHEASIRSVAYSPDGQTLVSGGHDQKIRLWNVKTGQIIKTFQGHNAAIWSVAFSPDGQTIASSSEDQTIKLWNIKTGQSLKSFQGHQAAIWSIAFSPQGTMLVSGALEPIARLWNVNTGECIKTLEGHENWVWSVAFSPDGNILASTSPDGTLRFWNVSTGECLKTVQGETGWLQLIAFSPDSRTIASCSQDYTIKLWNTSTGKCFKSMQGHKGLLWSVTFCLDGQTLASSSEDETIRIWDVKTGECLKTLRTENPYDRVNLMNATGLTEATIATLKALGATND
jgi:WD40 repeat protein